MKISIVSIFLALALSSCGNESREPITLYEILPPQASFSAIRKNLAGIPWQSFVDTRKLPFIPERSGVRLGTTLAQWSLAATLGDEKSGDLLAGHLVRLAKEMDIDDEALLIRVKNRLDQSSIKNRDEAGIRSDIRFIEKEMRLYFEQKNKTEWNTQFLFGSWLEFLSIILQGLESQKDPAFTGVLSRAHEADFFLERFSQANGDYARETAFLKSARSWFQLQEDRGLKTAEIQKLSSLVKELKVIYDRKK